MTLYHPHTFKRLTSNHRANVGLSTSDFCERDSNFRRPNSSESRSTLTNEQVTRETTDAFVKSIDNNVKHVRTVIVNVRFHN
jgi:negative regulator of replication initiation